MRLEHQEKTTKNVKIELEIANKLIKDYQKKEQKGLKRLQKEIESHNMTKTKREGLHNMILEKNKELDVTFFFKGGNSPSK